MGSSMWLKWWRRVKPQLSLHIPCNASYKKLYPSPTFSRLRNLGIWELYWKQFACIMAGAVFLAPTSRSSLSLYFALRFLQVGSCSIAGFIVCYLIWQHNNHYCTRGQCELWQMRETIVPKVYIFLVTTIVAAIISAFALSYRQLTFFVEAIRNLDPLTDFPTRPVRLPLLDQDFTKGDGEPPMPITIWLRNLPQSIPQVSLVTDVLILLVFLLSWQEYSHTMILGPVIPYCRLWKNSQFYNSDYWKNLRVIDKECILSQCSWATCLFSLGFTFMIILLESYYVYKECEQKRMRERASEKLEMKTEQGEKVVNVAKP